MRRFFSLTLPRYLRRTYSSFKSHSFHLHRSRSSADASSTKRRPLIGTDFAGPSKKVEVPNTGEIAGAPSSDSPKEDSSPTPTKRSGGVLTTALNGLILSLRVLSGAPLPGIDLATTVLLESIDRIRDISANAAGFALLLERMDLLNPLVKQLPKENAAVEQVSSRLSRELKQLSLDIDDAQASGKIASFFNNEDNTASVQNHTKTIDSIVIDLSAIVGLDTNRQIQEAVRKIQASDAERDHLVDIAYADISTERPSGGPGGNAMYNNIGTTSFEGSHSRIRTGGGHLFSGNRV